MTSEKSERSATMLCCLFSKQRSCFWIATGIMVLKLHIFLLLRCLWLRRGNSRSQTCPCSIQRQSQRMWPRWRMQLRELEVQQETISGHLQGSQVPHEPCDQKLQQHKMRGDDETTDRDWQSQSGTDTCPSRCTGEESYQCWEIQFKNLEKQSCSYSLNNMCTVYSML